MCGFSRSAGVMLSMIPWIRLTSPSASMLVEVAGHLVQAGDLAHQVLDGPHLLHLDDLLAEVVEVELPLGQLLLLPLGLLLVDGRLRRLDQADDVAHAEHLADEPLGVERLELVELLALADELDRHARSPCRTESAAPPRASPSSLVRITPSSSSALLKAPAEATASWPVRASQTK